MQTKENLIVFNYFYLVQIKFICFEFELNFSFSSNKLYLNKNFLCVENKFNPNKFFLNQLKSLVKNKSKRNKIYFYQIKVF